MVQSKVDVVFVCFLVKLFLLKAKDSDSDQVEKYVKALKYMKTKRKENTIRKMESNHRKCTQILIRFEFKAHGSGPAGFEIPSLFISNRTNVL